MITIVGNNFGGSYAGQQLASVETRYYVIVNGNLTVNAQAAAYQAAEVLELQVEGLLMGASAPAAVYAKCEVAGQAYITIVKSWIKDQHTICIEKVPGWASVSSYVLSSKQTEAYNAAKAQWVEEAGIKVDMNALKD